MWTPIPTVVYYDSTNNVNGPTTVVNRCVPVAGDEPAIITFSDGAGRIVSDLNASSMGSLGRLSFPFLYAGNSSAGTVDLAVATLQGTRSLFGSFSVRASELGVTLYLALGPIRPTGPLPAQTSAVNQAEFSQAVVFFEGFQTAAYFPPASQGPGGHFPPGSCRHTVTEGEDLDSIARRYLLNWQARPPRPAPPCRSVSLQLQNPSLCTDCLDFLDFEAAGRRDPACHSAATPKCARAAGPGRRTSTRTTGTWSGPTTCGRGTCWPWGGTTGSWARASTTRPGRADRCPPTPWWTSGAGASDRFARQAPPHDPPDRPPCASPPRARARNGGVLAV